MTNYRQIFAIQKKIEQDLIELCPTIDHKSGIYFWIREDEEGKYAYIGKSIDVLKRNVSHIQGRQQRIDGSLKKRGLYSKDNQLGWRLGVLYFSKEQLDEKEHFYIDKYKNASYVLYNVEDGGTIGKTIIGDKKPPKGYRDGVAYGKKKLARDLTTIIDKYLIVSAKDTSKRSQNALEKFWKLLEGPKKEETNKGEEDANIQQD